MCTCVSQIATLFVVIKCKYSRVVCRTWGQRGLNENFLNLGGEWYEGVETV